MQSQEFAAAIIEYVRRLPELSAQYSPSHFWHQNVRDFDAAVAAARDEKGALSIDDVWELAAKLPQEPPARFGRRTRPQHLLRNKIRYALHRNRIAELPREDAENIAAVLFLGKLKKKDLILEYEALRQAIGVDSSMIVARHFYYVTLVEDYARKVLGEKRPLRVLEIGGGGGTFARILYERGLIAEYHDLDLPEILLSASLALSRGLPHETFRFGGVTLPGASEGPATFNFWPAQHAGDLPCHHFDLIVNFASFQEMDNETRDGYVRSVRDYAAGPTIFINSNRLQNLPQADGSTRLNHPLLYPYDPREEVLEWGVDLAQDTARTNSAYDLYAVLPKSFSIIRVSVIK
jgi:hypothetical protein